MVELTQMQEKVKNRVLNSSGKEVITLRGYAGTGKTFTATEIIKEKIYNDKSAFVCVIAPTNAALGVLRNKLRHIQTSRLKFKTLSNLMTKPQSYVAFKGLKFILDDSGMHELTNLLESIKCTFIDKIIIRDTKMRFDYLTQTYEPEDIFMINKEMLYSALSKKLKGLKLNDIDLNTEFIYSQPKEIRNKLKSFNLVVIDEMPMVNQDETDLLNDAMRLANNEYPQSSLANSENVPNYLDKYPTYLFVGDNGQLQPVEGKTNKYMKEEALEEENDIYQLTEILRSTDEISKIGQLINKKMKINQLVDFYPSIINNYKDLSVEELIDLNINDLSNSDICLTFTNYNVKLLNQKIREYKGFSETKEVKPGEQLIITSNARDENNEIVFANGEEYMVEKIFSSDETESLLKSDDSIFTNIKERAEENPKFKDIFQFVEVIAREEDFKLALLKNNEEEKYAWLSSDLTKNKSFKFEQSIIKLNDLAMINGGIAPYVDADFGYARTVYKSQGSEWDDVSIILTKKDMYITSGKTNLPYTAVTRAKNKLSIYYEK